MVQRLAATRGGALDHEVLDDLVLPGRDLRQRLIELFRLQGGEVTEPTQVNTQHGALIEAHLVGRTQNRPVAAEHDDEVDITLRQRFVEIERNADDLKMPFNGGTQPIDSRAE